jgi:hypothetical protein
MIICWKNAARRQVCGNPRRHEHSLAALGPDEIQVLYCAADATLRGCRRAAMLAEAVKFVEDNPEKATTWQPILNSASLPNPTLTNE